MRILLLAALCDVNVLLALVTERHAHHIRAVRWFDSVSAGDVVVCRTVQMGLLRLLNNPAVMREEVLDAVNCWMLWQRLLGDDRIRFTVIEPVGLDAAFEKYTSGRLFSPRLWTDAYLAAYALAADLTLITFDRGFHAFADLACQVIDPNKP